MPNELSPVSGAAAVAILALITTKVVDAFRQLDPDDKLPKITWIVSAWIVGIVICLIWQINALVGLDFGRDTRLTGIAGQVVTGFLTGAGGSGWHELLDNLSSGAKAKRAAAHAGVARGAPRSGWIGRTG